ncbi:MAG: hypothetical protein D6776_10215, partial [Planctomycetota bacterium]
MTLASATTAPPTPAAAGGLWNTLRSVPPWVVYTVGAVVLALLLAAVGVWWWRRRRARARAAGTPPRPAIGRRTLVRIWRQFVRQIPREFRRTIERYPTFVVFGEAASGKTGLISRSTDWQGQAAKFYSSYSVRPELQVYLGSRAVVQEIPAALMHDTSPAARAALHRLWKRQFRRRDPMVVIAISAAALKDATPDALRRQAQLLRGKINVLSRLRRDRIPTRIVLTHMDKVDGFLAFSQFLEQHEIPLKLSLEGEDEGGRDALAHALDRYERYLPLALTSLSARAYRKVLTFLHRAPSLLALLDVFRNTLQEPDPLSHEPAVGEIYLTSETSGGAAAGGSGPFEVAWNAEQIAEERARRERWHRRVPVAAAVLLSAALVAGYLDERRDWLAARSAQAAFARSFDVGQTAALERELGRLGARDRGGLLSALRPRFFTGAAAKLRRSTLATLREHVLLPAFERAAQSPQPAEARLAALAALYASRDNALGTLLREHLETVAQLADIPPHLLSLALQCADRPWRGVVTLAATPYPPADRPLASPEPWHAFFGEVRERMQQGRITAQGLRSLQRTAARLETALAQLRNNALALDLYHALERSAPLELGRVFGRYVASLQPPTWLRAHGDAIAAALALVRSRGLDDDALEAVGDMPLRAFVQRLRSRARPTDEPEQVLRFTLLGEPFAFSNRTWDALLRSSAMRALVQRYVAATSQRSAYAFFSDATDYPPVALRFGRRGAFLFRGDARVPGIYTRPAYETEVRAQLLSLGALLDDETAAPRLPAAVRADLERLIETKLAAYARAYATAWRALCGGFSVLAPSRGALLIVLRRMRRSDGPFLT